MSSFDALVCKQVAQLQHQLQQQEESTQAVQQQIADAEEVYEKLHSSYCSLEEQQADVLQHSAALEQQLANAQEQLQGDGQALQAENHWLLADLEFSQDQVLVLLPRRCRHNCSALFPGPFDLIPIHWPE